MSEDNDMVTAADLQGSGDTDATLDSDQIEHIKDLSEQSAKEIEQAADKYNATVPHVFEVYVQSIAHNLQERDNTQNWGTRSFIGALQSLQNRFSGVI